MNQFRERLGAPSLAEAVAAAEEELAFAASLCNHPADTLIAVERRFEDGAIRERFRAITPSGDGPPMRAFSFLEVEGDDEDEMGEEISLVDLAKPKSDRSSD